MEVQEKYTLQARVYLTISNLMVSESILIAAKLEKNRCKHCQRDQRSAARFQQNRTRCRSRIVDPSSMLALCTVIQMIE